MNQRLSGILIIALLVSAAATYIVYRVVVGRTAKPTAQSIHVVRAAHTLEIGTLLRDVDLQDGEWVGTPPTGMATKKETLVGRGVVATIYQGEPIMETRLAVSGAGAGLAATIPAGMRAVALRVNDIVGVAGFVLAGMRVDILISGNVPNAPATNGPQVKTILQNIEVLSAGQNYQKDAEGKPIVVPVVNLLVTPDQAETLSLASNEARIQLVLRNPLDTKETKTAGVSVAGLYGQAKPTSPAPQTRPVVRVAARPAQSVNPQPILVSLPPIEIEVLNGDKQAVAKFAPAGLAVRPPGEKK